MATETTTDFCVVDTIYEKRERPLRYGQGRVPPAPAPYDSPHYNSDKQLLLRSSPSQAVIVAAIGPFFGRVISLWERTKEREKHTRSV